jgi:hypothetical protein
MTRPSVKVLLTHRTCSALWLVLLLALVLWLLLLCLPHRLAHPQVCHRSWRN